MNLESFLAELRAARAEGVVFTLDKGRIRAIWPVLHARRCPLEVVGSRATHQEVPYYMVAGTIGMGLVLSWHIMRAADTGGSLAFRATRDRLLEACGLAEQTPTP